MLKVSKRKKLIIIISTIILLLNICLYVTVSVLSKNSFGTRYDSKMLYTMDEFSGMKREDSSFVSDMGQKLKGYIYSKDSNEVPRGLIILAHGLGGGHNSYIPQIYYFINNGYTVFAYDGTGCDESEGETIIGLPQAVTDLRYALKHIETIKDIAGLKRILYGHSWGGYAVTAALNFEPKVDGVVALSGFSSISDISSFQAKNMIGPVAPFTYPYIKLYNLIHYGKAASLTGMDGLKKTTAKVMIIHSKDDTVVDYKNYVNYYDEFKDNPNFTFKSYDDRKHFVELSSKTQADQEEVYTVFNNLTEEKGSENITEETKNSFRKQLMDIYKSNLDKEFMEQLVVFFDKVVQ